MLRARWGTAEQSGEKKVISWKFVAEAWNGIYDECKIEWIEEEDNPMRFCKLRRVSSRSDRTKERRTIGHGGRH